MSLVRLAVCALFVTSVAVPAFAQDPAPSPSTGEAASAAPASTPDEQLAAPQPLRLAPIDNNAFKLSAHDFRNFFSADTGRTLSYVAIVAIASAP